MNNCELKSNLLFLAPRLPYPLDTGGKIRTYHVLRLLSKCYNVDLLTFIFSDDEKDLIAELEKKLSINVFSVRNTKLNLGVVFSSLLTGKPISYQRYYKKAFTTCLYSLLRTKEYKLVHCDHLHMGQYIDIIRKYVPRLPVRLDEHNVEFVIAERVVSRVNNPLLKTIFADQYYRIRMLEKSVCEKSNEIWVVSEEDRNKLISALELKDDSVINNKILIVPNGVDLEYFKFAGYSGGEKDIVFVGSLDWMPNEDGLIYFIQEVWPIISSYDKEIKFYIVGRNPSRRILQYKSNNIIITGAVDDVRPYLYRSAVSVVPLRIGGGSRLKILESMAAGRVVVSTSLGAEGICYESGKNILIAEDKNDFARFVIELIVNLELRNKIAKAAYNLVESKYQWKLPND